jgi:hypothetical protein
MFLIRTWMLALFGTGMMSSILAEKTLEGSNWAVNAGQTARKQHNNPSRLRNGTMKPAYPKLLVE